MDEEREQNRLEEAGLAVQIAVLAVLLHRLRKLDAGTTYAVARALEAKDMAEVERILERGRDLITDRAGEVIDETAKGCDTWAAPYYAAAGRVQAPALEGMATAQAVRTAKAAAAVSIRDMCDSHVLRLVANDGTLMPFRQAYRAEVDTAVRTLAQGRDTYYELLRKTAERLGGTGLRVQYESGATRDLYSALAQNVMDTAARAQADIREVQGREFGADGVAVSAHAPCAPDHLDYQGREYTTAEFAELQGRLRRPIGMWNCRHTVSPVIIGVSPEFHGAEELEELRRASTAPTGIKTKDGRDMTAYEFAQWQRATETKVRQLQAQAYLCEQAGVENGAIKARVKDLRREYGRRNRLAKIEGRPERMAVYVLE